MYRDKGKQTEEDLDNDDLTARAEKFISMMRKQMKLERIESLLTFPEMLNKDSGSIKSRGEKVDDALLKGFKKKYLAATVALNDVEQKKYLGPEVGHWLIELKHALYQVEDILDEISTNALQRSLEAEIQTSTLNSFPRGIEYKMEELSEILDNLLKQKDMVGWKDSSDISLPQRLSTTSHVLDVSDIFGRYYDKKYILDLLLSDDANGKDLFVIPIVGMGGVGKTTLAQLAFDDFRVIEHFDFRLWVCVGNDFDVFSVTKASLEALTLQSCDIQDLYSLQVALKNGIAGKKCLLILDDVWSANYSDWNIFFSPFNAGARGSKVVVTTRSHVVASIMQTAFSYNLNQLVDEDCWKMFEKFAFEQKQLSSNPELEAVGKVIVKKCNGLPLAIKSVGALLRHKPTVTEWSAMLEKLDSPSYISHILPSLKLSYDSLPAHLKRCFAYCSIFPKGFKFEREKLILIWMAEGLLQQSKIFKRLEDVGDEYFYDLVSRSFFQQSSDKSHFVMHDLMNDLAKCVSGVFCYRLENSVISPISNKARHLSFSRSQSDIKKILESISTGKLLRTILPFELSSDHDSSQLSNQIPLQKLLSLKRLRVLCLSHYHITSLPEAIGCLQHLRYLDLSNTEIKKLPEFLCSLCNLQTLLLSNCHYLTELPRNLEKLINLRYLDLVGTRLKEMPTEIGRLKSLQMLSNFVVGKYGGIKELGGLLHLHGTLCISELHNVVSATDANEASLKKKQYLDGLVFEWNVDTDDSNSQKDVLEMLQPNQNLKCLSISSYGGTKFPNWLGHTSFSNMVFLCLSNCRNCLVLPPLGQLPSLKELVIEKLYVVKSIGFEFYGGDILLIKPFQSLKTLKFDEMACWEEWVTPEIEGGAFPCLQELCINRCPKLIRDLPKNFPSFAKVTISECPCFEATLRILPVIDELGEEDNDKELESLYTEDLSPTDLQLYDSPNLQSYNDEKPSTILQKNTTKDNLQSYDDGDKKVHQKNNEKIVDASTRIRTTLGGSLHEDKEMPSRVEDEVASQNSENKTEVSNMSYMFPSVSSERFSEIQRFGYEGASQSAIHLTGVPNITSSAHIPVNTWFDQYVPQDILTFEILKVSEISQLMELPPGLCSLKIEGCDALEFFPDGLMGSNPYLQDLLIVNCCNFKSFPGGFPPTDLKYLYLHECRKLEFIRSEQNMHQYALIEYLFIGSSCDTLQSFPIAFFPKLKSLSIWDCTNFCSISIPKGMVEDLISLEALEIRDCPNLVSLGELPTPKLTSVSLSNCKSLEALPDQLYRLCSLQSLFINECPKLATVPVGGFPPNLSTLCISCCPKFTPQVEWGLQEHKNLHCFEIEDGCGELVSFPNEKLLPRNLYSLRISGYPNLKFLDCKGLEHLGSLQILEINSCNNLVHLPDEGLPPSLSFLHINDCPLLKAELQNKIGNEWHKIAHIPHVQIDEEVIL